MSTRYAGTVLITMSIGVGACGGEGPVQMDPEPPAVADTVLVGASGATATLLEGAVQLGVGAGALASETPISVTRIETTGLDGAVAGAVFEFGPDGLEFDEPVELTIAFDPALLADGVEADALRLHGYTSGSPELIDGSRVDTDGSTVTGLIDGFSSYGAGEVSIAALEASVARLQERWREQVDDPPARERTGEALLDDILVLQRKLSRRCASSDELPAIAADLTRLGELMALVQEFYGGSYDFLADACGGILDESATDIRIEPASVTLTAGQTQQYTATVLGPPGRTRELRGGTVLWDTSEGVATIGNSTGLLEAVGVGSGIVFAAVEVGEGFYITSREPASVRVRGPLALDVSPAGPVVFAMRQWTVFDAVVRDSVTGEPVDGILVEGAATDPSLVDISLAVEGIPVPNGRKVEGARLGTSVVRGCAGEEPMRVCHETPVETVWNITGTWAFRETLTTQLEPPASETCTIEGTVTLEQHGTAYSGTSDETADCTYDPGDGSEPESYSFQTTGVISNGLVSGTQYGHTVTIAGEECTSSAVLGATSSPGLAEFANGTTRCQDLDGFISSGPSSGEWREGSHHTRLETGGG